MSYTSRVDIANRALQHVGATRISTFDDVTKQAAEVSFCYEKLRRAELRRSVWRFATKRAVLRAYAHGDLRFVPPVYDPVTVYPIGSIVQDTAGVYWQSTVGLQGSAPGLVLTGAPAAWQQYFGPLHASAYSTGVNYYANELVYDTGGIFYTALFNNLGNAALANSSLWTQHFTSPGVAGAGYARPMLFMVAAGPGVTINGRDRNIFPLPNGFLRATYQDPKTASTATNVTSAGLQFSDWQFESDYIVSAEPGPLILRFVADVSDVSTMDDLFCEGLGARVGYEICETMTQSNIKLQAIGQAYQKFMSDARLINHIENAGNEPMEEQYELTQGPANVQESLPTSNTGSQR